MDYERLKQLELAHRHTRYQWAAIIGLGAAFVLYVGFHLIGVLR